MPCYRPIEAWRMPPDPETGRGRLTFRRSEGYSDRKGEYVPCGQCIGCRLEYSRQWAMRMVHEASLYEENCFITLTFKEECLPSDNSVNVRDYQLFMKKFRKKYGTKRRFFHVGEYGSENGRPHYHAIIFNHDFGDKKLWKITKSGDPLYTSEELQRLWPYGFSSVAAVTFETAAYVARYAVKKQTGASSHAYEVRCPMSGVLLERIAPEYATMSRRPGIGRGWFERYKDQTYRDDSVVIRGKQMRPPRAYDEWLKAEDPKLYAQVKNRRRSKAIDHRADTGSRRLHDREHVQDERALLLIRGMSEETEL